MIRREFGLRVPSIYDNLDNDTNFHLNELVDIAVIWDTNATVVPSDSLRFCRVFHGFKTSRSWPLIGSDLIKAGFK